MIVRPQTVAQHSLLLVGLIAGTGTVACTGAIEVISAEPFRLVCPGDDVTVSWEATGPVTFSASPSARVPSAGDPVGSFSTIIRSTTTFTVRSGTDSETIEVEVLESGESLEGIGADLICSNCGIPQWSTDVTRGFLNPARGWRRYRKYDWPGGNGTERWQLDPAAELRAKE